MRVFKTKKELNKFLAPVRKSKQSIGLVPTMGALHAGHLSLVSKAVEGNDLVVVSIFINPTQFDNQNDLENYPKNLEKDLSLLESASEKLVVFAPSREDIYDNVVASKEYTFDGLDKVMEGTYRKGHFEGVATIVELLFKAVQPDTAYFGEKDFQQLQIIKKLVEQLQLNIEIIPCPILREENGLAMSSRNELLSKSSRKDGGFIFNILETAKSKFGIENAISITEWVKGEFAQNEHFELEYFQIADVDSLTPIKKRQKQKKYRAFIAVYADSVRLIDNIALN